MINALHASSMRLSYFGNLIHDIVRLAESFNSISFMGSRRTDNILTHRLALFSFTCDGPLDSYSIPTTLEDSVLAIWGLLVD